MNWHFDFIKQKNWNDGLAVSSKKNFCSCYFYKYQQNSSEVLIVWNHSQHDVVQDKL